MGERTCETKPGGGALLLPALHSAGPMSGRYLQDALEIGLLASDLTAVSFGAR